MDGRSLEQVLGGLHLGGLRYYDTIGSTNDEASRWADAGAPDLALVIADEQTAGRGRGGRRWYTPPSSALAFSLVLKEQQQPADRASPASSFPLKIAWITALGALAVSQTLSENYQLEAKIKWPNDVLLERRKVAGVLAEAHWQGDQLSAVILGIGINIAPESVPPAQELAFPATCVQTVLGRPLDRTDLLRSVISNLTAWRQHLGKPEFLASWEEQLAFRGEWVTIKYDGGAEKQQARQGQVLGLDSQGRLKLRDPSGEAFVVQAGEVHLRV